MTTSGVPPMHFWIRFCFESEEFYPTNIIDGIFEDVFNVDTVPSNFPSYSRYVQNFAPLDRKF